MKPIKALALALALTFPLQTTAVNALTLDLGGVRIRLPKVTKQRSTTPSTRTPSTYSTHPRWATVLEGTYRMATNGQGIWIGYDERGTMLIQLELPNAASVAPGTAIPVQVEINGRLYQSVIATVVNEYLAVVQGADVERILGRLMSGRTIAMVAGANRLETHLTGSSNAIREVRNEAAVQSQLYASGQVQPQQDLASGEPELKDEDVTLYYLPGIEGYGVADVRFDLKEREGLIIYIYFEPVEGHEDPRHAIEMNVSETARAIELIRKGEEWTEVARDNRVGLYSKRIGFIDDDLAPASSEPETREGAGVTGTVAEPSDPAPKDFRAVNFNSYENGDTSVQIEHSVGGFSRRFNLSLDEALELADFLENTVEQRSFQFENREMSEEEKEKLFQ